MGSRIVLLAATVAAGFSPLLAGGTRGAEPGADQVRSLVSQLITDQVRQSLPEKYEDARRWGMTKEVFDGVKISEHGAQLKTHERTRQVNHGTWRRYEATLIDPGEKFKIEIGPMSTLSDGRTAFDVVGTAPVHAVGQLAQWELGLQLASFKVEAEATVRVRVALVVGLEFDTAGLLPALVIKPQATDANVALADFRLTRVSKLKGPLVKEFNGEVRDAVDRLIAKKRQKLVDSVNRQIAKSQNKLRIAPGELVAAKLPSLKSLFGGETPSDTAPKSSAASAGGAIPNNGVAPNNGATPPRDATPGAGASIRR